MYGMPSKRQYDFGDTASKWDQSPGSLEDKKKKKRSRWAQEEIDKTIIPGMPTVIPMGLNDSQERQYLLHLQIEEISRRLRTGDLGIPPNPEDRSPSPEPIYNNEGKRLNTREYRTRKKLEEERHKLVQEAMGRNLEYKPPADYKPPVIRVNDKVMIPQEEHPDINFVGLLIGPRGNTLKNLEKETGAKIIIRGKGSVKEGKIGRKDGQPLPGEDEPLHAYVTANNPENVKKAVEKIKEIITQGIEVPEGQNDLRRQQLRELALLNGTLRENDGLAKLKQLQQAQTIITNTIVCTVCGGTGHIAQDCKQKRPGDTFRLQQAPLPSTADKAKMDSEYMSLMAELGEGPPPGQKPEQQPHVQTQQQHFRPQFHNPPPPNPMVSMPRQDFRASFQRQSQPHSLAINQPWQQQNITKPPPHMMGMITPPPPFMPGQPPVGAGVQPPVSNPPMQQPGPPSMPGPGPMPGPVPPPGPPMFSGAPVPPPWQQPPASSVPTHSQPTMTSTVGVPPPPPSLMTPPPPPPPNSQLGSAPSLPWLQHQNTSLPPPPPVSSAGHWQAPGNMIPPPPPSNIPPWQQHHAGPPPGQAPPPPPPVNQGYPSMPPPPPPAGFDVNAMPGGNVNPLLVAPPPPPPS